MLTRPLGTLERDAERVPEDQLLERDARPEAQRARAQPADRPRRDLDHPGAVAVDPELRMYRTVGDADGSRRLRGEMRARASTISSARRDGVT